MSILPVLWPFEKSKLAVSHFHFQQAPTLFTLISEVTGGEHLTRLTQEKEVLKWSSS